MVLMPDTTLMLLDEPVAGVNPLLVDKIGELLTRLVGRGLTLIVIEHNVPFVVACCTSVLAMSCGKRIAEGSGRAIQEDEQVLEAFLGGG
jgi:ABC-type branched-subunit amino acid transport system ATPase component